jgi:2-keto-3-deoxy-L-rhamnonate aldolase RhmA
MGGWVEHTERNVLVIPIIESQRAVDNFDEIASLDGVVSCASVPATTRRTLVPFNAPVAAAWERTRSIAVRHGKRVMAASPTPGCRVAAWPSRRRRTRDGPAAPQQGVLA